ncbi:MAG TPA: phage terminase small subunit P27 family [Candidatus Acidoferrum sp.]|jgi:P27 family predicted phage terminase small subunit
MAAPRKLEAIHELHGTKPHDRAADISHVPAGRPRFPKDLDESLRPIFKRKARELSERRTITAGDADLIRLFCFAYERHERNAKLLREEGEVCEYVRLDSNGQPHVQVKKNIRHDIVTNAERQMAAILNQLGLTPVSKDRARPTRPADEEVQLDPMEQFLAGKAPAPTIVPFTPMKPPSTFEGDDETENHAEDAADEQA